MLETLFIAFNRSGEDPSLLFKKRKFDAKGRQVPEQPGARFVPDE